MGKRYIVIDKGQLTKALTTLCCEDGKVDLQDVFGVLDCCTTWITNDTGERITRIPSYSVRKRLEEQKN